jgi:hypothetical protein
MGVSMAERDKGGQGIKKTCFQAAKSAESRFKGVLKLSGHSPIKGSDVKIRSFFYFKNFATN